MHVMLHYGHVGRSCTVEPSIVDCDPKPAWDTASHDVCMSLN